MEFGKWGELIEVFLAKNSQINLSAIRDADGVYVKHILDSLELLKIFSFTQGQRVCDLGTGGGFPLLPLAIENPGVQFVGMDARKKKLQAISEMIESLQGSMVSGEGSMVLGNVDLVWSRVEEYKGAKFDVVMARAVAHVEVLIPWMMQIVNKKGKLVLYKQLDSRLQNASLQTTEKTEHEVLVELCKKYKLSIEKEHKYVFEGSDVERVIYVLII